ncbi:unnamed protein product [Phytophthora lilii]|uniref:Unnamed protein product n=1 Tax=Phytophthora lilii TaxID=2077276 RepID=A0A9W6TUG2_9STRA|nr:unnamed protein product [Phytophthora lilii]
MAVVTPLPPNLKEINDIGGNSAKKIISDAGTKTGDEGIRDDLPLLKPGSSSEDSSKYDEDEVVTIVLPSTTKGEWSLEKLRGLGYIVIAAFNFSIVSACVKNASHYANSNIIVFWRMLIGLAMNCVRASVIVQLNVVLSVLITFSRRFGYATRRQTCLLGVRTVSSSSFAAWSERLRLNRGSSESSESGRSSESSESGRSSSSNESGTPLASAARAASTATSPAPAPPASTRKPTLRSTLLQTTTDVQTTLGIATNGFSDDELGKAVLDAAQKGVKVRIYMDFSDA